MKFFHILNAIQNIATEQSHSSARRKKVVKIYGNTFKDSAVDEIINNKILVLGEQPETDTDDEDIPELAGTEA